jgi:hypothetical protein
MIYGVNLPSAAMTGLYWASWLAIFPNVGVFCEELPNLIAV